MPILDYETDQFPDNLVESVAADELRDGSWWALYTRSRQEKQLMRRLVGLEIPFYSPLIERRYRSPAGRLRVSYQPLFPGYVFIYGDEYQRTSSLSTSCVSRWFAVSDQGKLADDLMQINKLIEIGYPVSPEARLAEGDRVRVRSGPFSGFEGVVIRRERHRRLLVSVEFAYQGASVQLDDCQLERI